MMMMDVLHIFHDAKLEQNEYHQNFCLFKYVVIK